MGWYAPSDTVGLTDLLEVKKSIWITRTDQCLRTQPARCALAVIRPAQEDYFAIKHERPGQRRSHKKATVAIAHKTTVCTCYMPKGGEVHPPTPRPREAEEPQAEAQTAHRAAGNRSPEGTRLRNARARAA